MYFNKFNAIQLNWIELNSNEDINVISVGWNRNDYQFYDWQTVCHQALKQTWKQILKQYSYLVEREFIEFDKMPRRKQQQQQQQLNRTSCMIMPFFQITSAMHRIFKVKTENWIS